MEGELMVKRKELKFAHEDAVLLGFIGYIESNGGHIEVVDKPDPPEAIVKINGKKTWIEVTDAFLDRRHAISLTSCSSEDVEDQPDDRRMIIEPDAIFRSQLVSVISKKYEKKSMIKIKDELGGGILLVGVFTPFNTARGIVQEENKTIEKLIQSKSCKVFNEIYVYDGTGAREYCRIYPLCS